MNQIKIVDVVVCCAFVPAFLESGRKPLASVVQGLNALVVALKVWSTKGEVSDIPL